MTLSLHDSVSLLKGVGEKRLQVLKKAGILTVEDLLAFFPREYRSGECFPLGEERVGKASYYRLTVRTSPVIYTVPGGRRALRYTAEDENGIKVQVLYFNQVYLRHQLSVGDCEYYYGTLQEKNGTYYLFSPQRQAQEPDKNLLTPIYPELKGISSRTVE
jgi:ATP-dependent DNA helicase RecG